MAGKRLTPKQVLSRIPRLRKRLQRLQDVVIVSPSDLDDYEEFAEETAERLAELALSAGGSQKAALEAMADRARSLGHQFRPPKEDRSGLPEATFSEEVDLSD